MRSFGSHRGNPALRIMIEQAARRRLWASLGPERPGGSIAGALGSQGSHGALGAKSPREAFTALDAIVRERFAVLEQLPQGTLGDFGSPEMQLWSLRSEHAIVLALDHEDSATQIVARAARWNACLTTRTAPGLASPHWGHPVYGARLDPLTGELDVVWAFAGRWCELLRASPALERKWDRPDHWSSLIGAGT